MIIEKNNELEPLLLLVLLEVGEARLWVTCTVDVKSGERNG